LLRQVPFASRGLPERGRTEDKSTQSARPQNRAGANPESGQERSDYYWYLERRRESGSAPAPARRRAPRLSRPATDSRPTTGGSAESASLPAPAARRSHAAARWPAPAADWPGWRRQSRASIRQSPGAARVTVHIFHATGKRLLRQGRRSALSPDN